MENENIEVNEVEDRKIAFTEEEANKIRETVKRIQEEVENELEKSRSKEEMQGRSR